MRREKVYIALLLLQRLLQVLEHNSVHVGDHLPDERQNGRNGFLVAFGRMSCVEHHNAKLINIMNKNEVQKRIKI